MQKPKGMSRLASVVTDLSGVDGLCDALADRIVASVPLLQANAATTTDILDTIDATNEVLTKINSAVTMTNDQSPLVASAEPQSALQPQEVKSPSLSAVGDAPKFERTALGMVRR